MMFVFLMKRLSVVCILLNIVMLKLMYIILVVWFLLLNSMLLM